MSEKPLVGFVSLPTSDRAGSVWVVDDGNEIHAQVDDFGPRAAVQTGEFWVLYPADVLRRRALAELAAADRAEQLAAEVKGATA